MSVFFSVLISQRSLAKVMFLSVVAELQQITSIWEAVFKYLVDQIKPGNSVHACYPSTWEAEEARIISSNPF